MTAEIEFLKKYYGESYRIQKQVSLEKVTFYNVEIEKVKKDIVNLLQLYRENKGNNGNRKNNANSGDKSYETYAKNPNDKINVTKNKSLGAPIIVLTQQEGIYSSEEASLGEETFQEGKLPHVASSLKGRNQQVFERKGNINENETQDKAYYTRLQESIRIQLEKIWQNRIASYTNDQLNKNKEIIDFGKEPLKKCHRMMKRLAFFLVESSVIFQYFRELKKELPVMNDILPSEMQSLEENPAYYSFYQSQISTPEQKKLETVQHITDAFFLKKLHQLRDLDRRFQLKAFHRFLLDIDIELTHHLVQYYHCIFPHYYPCNINDSYRT